MISPGCSRYGHRIQSPLSQRHSIPRTFNEDHPLSSWRINMVEKQLALSHQNFRQVIALRLIRTDQLSIFPQLQMTTIQITRAPEINTWINQPKLFLPSQHRRDE